jgi:hypothetical protein
LDETPEGVGLGDKNHPSDFAGVTRGELRLAVLMFLAWSLEGQGSPQQLEESERRYWEAYGEAVKAACTPEKEPQLQGTFYEMWAGMCVRFAGLLRARGQWEMAETVGHEYVGVEARLAWGGSRWLLLLPVLISEYRGVCFRAMLRRIEEDALRELRERVQEMRKRRKGSKNGAGRKAGRKKKGSRRSQRGTPVRGRACASEQMRGLLAM